MCFHLPSLHTNPDKRRKGKSCCLKYTCGRSGAELRKGGAIVYQKKLEEDIRCPLEYGLEIFGGKWDSRVICVLNEKKVLRYSEISREMMNVTDAVLSSTLKKLIANGLIQRKSYDVIPPRVEYSLTDKGASVVPILQSICRWSGIFHKDDSEHTMTQCQKCDYSSRR